jgi:hypothetical protein
MTQDELTLLEKGRVPVEVVTTVLSKYIKESDRDANMCLEVLADKADIGYGTLEKWHFDGDRSKSVAFDVADRLMCAAGFGVFRWTRMFPEFYEHVDLKWKVCECPGCEIMFVPKHSANGPTGQRYCSAACRMSARHQRIGRTHRTVKRHRGDMLLADVCRNGHERTEENTYYRKNGKRECRLCKQVTNRSSYKRVRLAA